MCFAKVVFLEEYFLDLNIFHEIEDVCKCREVDCRCCAAKTAKYGLVQRQPAGQAMESITYQTAPKVF